MFEGLQLKGFVLASRHERLAALQAEATPAMELTADAWEQVCHVSSILQCCPEVEGCVALPSCQRALKSASSPNTIKCANASTRWECPFEACGAHSNRRQAADAAVLTSQQRDCRLRSAPQPISAILGCWLHAGARSQPCCRCICDADVCIFRDTTRTQLRRCLTHSLGAACSADSAQLWSDS